MEIRKACNSDYVKIIRAIQNKGIAYITPKHIREDIDKNRQYVMIDKGKVISILSLVYDSKYDYYAMKRLCVTNRKNHGKGYAQKMIETISNSVNGKVGCTPWADNAPMRHTLEKLGFRLEYVFREKWCFYSKRSAKTMTI